MQEVPLTKGFVALVDDEDFDLVSQFKWYAAVYRHTVYAVRNIRRDGKRVAYGLHNFIMNPPVNTEIDHRDRNGLNNIRSNLRICTHSQNASNRSIPSHNSSGYRGVGWKNGKWRATIMFQKTGLHLGYFEHPLEAAHAYDRKALELFGEFAQLNFPL